jgi:transposase
MKFVRALTATETQALRQLHKDGPTHRARQRAHALLLSAKGYTLEQLADIFDLDRDTLSQWMDVFHAQGVTALGDAPKSGRPRKLDAPIREMVVQTVRENPSPQVKTTLLQTLKKTR